MKLRWYDLHLSRLGLFPKPVEMSSVRSREACAAALSVLSRGVFDWKQRGVRPFIGEVSSAGGRLWYSRRQGRGMSSRSLTFTLQATARGCLLQGELVLTRPQRFLFLAYLFFCVCMGVANAALALVHRQFIGHVVLYFFGAPLFGLAFLYAFGSLGVWTGRRAEALGRRCSNTRCPTNTPRL